MNSINQSPKITVVIRKRPINKKELQRYQADIIKVENPGTVNISQCKQKVDLTKYIEETTFNFDYAFDENSKNQDIYSTCIQPLIDSAFMGAKVSCFAYGQTGSGKTFTMKGDTEKEIPGLYYLGAKEIFRYLNHNKYQHLDVTVSFFEIYCGKLYDLLNDRNELKIREDKKSNINVIGLQQKAIRSPEQFLQLIEYGSSFRVTSENATNADSSRSHAILQIQLKNGKKLFTKISFIDLAGNQRGADHMDQSKQTRIDGAEISKSLLALKECIRALDQGKGHTPFRGSKLTMVLKQSFVGFCKTVMIGNISPNVSAAENTMNTLRYADRVKQLKNQSDSTPMSKEEQLAKQMMLPRAIKNSYKVNIQSSDDKQDIQIKRDAARKVQRKQSGKPEWNNQLDTQQIPQQLIPKKRTDIYQSNNMKQQQRKLTVPKINQQPLQDQNNPSRQQIFPRGINQIKVSKELRSKNSQIQIADNGIRTNSRNSKKKNKNNFPKIEAITPTNQKKKYLEHKKMSQLVQQFKSEFLDDHFHSIKEEGTLLREEGMLFEKASKNPQFDLSSYINSVQDSINKKIQTLKALQTKAIYISGKVDECSNLSNSLAAYNSNLNDQQILQDLPNDEYGGRLF